jgi:hypothetical protein
MLVTLQIDHEDGEETTGPHGFVSGQRLDLDDHPNRITEIVNDIIGALAIEEDPDELGDVIDELNDGIDNGENVRTEIGPWEIELLVVDE